MVGLNSDPTADGSYSSLDYAMYCHADNTISIYESNSLIGNYGAYTTSSTLSIVYDGVNVTYYRDGTILRQVARAVGSALYLDSSFYSLNAAINSVKFGPALPNVGAQGTANYLAKFSTANSLVNSSIQDTGSGVIVNSVATPRYYQYNVNAGNAVRLGQWYATEGNVSFMIQVSSDTGSNSGTSTYLYNGGFNVISNTAGQYVKLIPLMIGRGHGDSADSSVNSTDAGGWTVFLYTGTTNPAYTMGIAVGVPTGKANKTLRITVTELRGGMTYTADGSSIAYPTTTYPNTLQHTYGAISSAGNGSFQQISATSAYYGQGFTETQYINNQVSEVTKTLYRQIPNTIGDYVELFEIASQQQRIELEVGSIFYPSWSYKKYEMTDIYYVGGDGMVPPVAVSMAGTDDYELEVLRYNIYYRRFRLKRTKGSGTTFYAAIKVKLFGYVSAYFTEYSTTGTSTFGNSYITLSRDFVNPNLYAPPACGGSGAGVSLNLYASSGVTSGAGGSIGLIPGAQAASGGDGAVIVYGAGGSGTGKTELNLNGRRVFYNFYRSLPTTVGNYVEVFQNYMNSQAHLRITIVAWRPTSASAKTTKVYEWNNNYNSNGAALSPCYVYPTGLNTDSDFELELNRNIPTGYNEYRLRRTAGTVEYRVYVLVELFNYSETLQEISGTGTSSLSASYLYLTRYETAISGLPPYANSGAGGNLNLYGASGVGTGAGGSIILQPGAQATTGGDGYLQIKGQGTSTVIKLTESAYNRSFTWTQDYSGASLSADGGLGGIILFSRFYIDTGGKIRSAYNNYVGLGNSNSQNYDNWGYIYLRNDGVINWWGDVGLTYGSVGQIRVSNASTGGGSFAYTSNTTNIAAATNNLALNGSAFQRLNCTAVCNLTGIAPPATGSHVDGRMIRVYNVGTSALTLKHNSTDSTDVNRFYNVDLNDIVLAPRDYAELIYDGTNNGRGGAGWRVH